jgi:hypothetical protein
MPTRSRRFVHESEQSTGPVHRIRSGQARGAQAEVCEKYGLLVRSERIEGGMIGADALLHLGSGVGSASLPQRGRDKAPEVGELGFQREQEAIGWPKWAKPLAKAPSRAKRAMPSGMERPGMLTSYAAAQGELRRCVHREAVEETLASERSVREVEAERQQDRALEET